MGAKRVVTFVCAVVVVGEVAYALPVAEEHSFEAPASAVDADGAEIIETTGEVVS